VGAGPCLQVATKTNPEPPLPWQHTCSQGAEDVLLDCRQPHLATQVIRDCSRSRVKTLRRLDPAVQALEGVVCHRGVGVQPSHNPHYFDFGPWHHLAYRAAKNRSKPRVRHTFFEFLSVMPWFRFRREGAKVGFDSRCSRVAGVRAIDHQPWRWKCGADFSTWPPCGARNRKHGDTGSRRRHDDPDVAAAAPNGPTGQPD
jgi:hypothetical protein